MKIPEIDELARLFQLMPNGDLHWIKPRLKTLAGRAAGCINSGGYRVVQVNGTLLSAHRIVWALTHGHWPQFDVDHINGRRDDNRPCNLRDVPVALNNQNIRAAYASSRSGLLGAHLCKRTGKFQSSIHADGRSIYLGHFPTAEAAHAAYMKAKAIYHPGFVQQATRACLTQGQRHE